MAEYRADIQGNIWKKLHELEKVANKTHKAIDNLKKPTAAAASGFKRLGGSMQLTSGFFDRMIAYASIWQGMELGKSIINRTAEFEGLATALNFASGSMELGGINMEYVTKTAKELGLALMPAMEGFTKLNAAAKGTQLTQTDVRDLFQGVSKAVSVLALNSEKAHGTYMAFEQILSKGKVSAEELRRQLGDRIPGAFQIAARAMGVTTTELDKLIRSGKLLSEDFLPKMARQMNEEFTPGIAKSSNTLRAHLNRLNTQLLLLKVGFGTAIIPELTKAIRKFGDLDKGLQRNINWFKEHKSTIYAFAKGVVTLTGALLALSAVMKVLSVAQFLAGLGPIGLAIAGITIAVAGAATWYGLFAEKIVGVTEAHLKLQKALDGSNVAEGAYAELVKMKEKFEADDNLTDAEKTTLAFGAKDQIDNLKAEIKRLQESTSVEASKNATGQIGDIIGSETGNRERGLSKYYSHLQEKGFDAEYDTFGMPDDIIQKMSKIKELYAIALEIEPVAQAIALKQAEIKLFQGLAPTALTKLRAQEKNESEIDPAAKDTPMAQVLGGGNRIINITIHKQIESFINQFDTSDTEDLGALKDRVKNIVAEALLEAVNQANQIAR